MKMKKSKQNTGLENIAEKKCKSDQFESFEVVQKVMKRSKRLECIARLFQGGHLSILGCSI